MTVDWSLCRYPACIEECRDAPKIDCPAVLAWREKKDETMTDAPSNRDELGRAINQRDYNRRLADHQKTVIDRLNVQITTQAARIAELEAALERIVSASDYFGKEATDHDTLTLAYAHQSTGHIARKALAKDTSHDG